MGLQSLDDVLQEQVKDLLSAEKQLVAALPKVAEAAHSPELKNAISEHLEQTRGHVQRLEKVTGMLRMDTSATTCKAMQGLVAEGLGSMGTEHVENGVADPHRWVQGAARILRHIGHDLAAQSSQGAGVATNDALAADLDRPTAKPHSRPGVPEQRQGQRALAAAGLAHHAENLAGADAKADVVDDRFAGIER